MAAEAGAAAAIEAWEKQWTEQIQKKKREHQNTRLWNTRMLLRHYRALKEYCKRAVYNRSTAVVTQDALEILETLGACSKDMYLESIKSSVVRTRTIMVHVDNMLKIYKAYCEISDKPEDPRRYRIIQASYLSDEKEKMDDILKKEGIDKSTYFRDKKESTAMLSALIFGADGLAAMRQR